MSDNYRIKNFSDEEINNLINKYSKEKAYRRDYYRERYKTDEKFREEKKKKSLEYYKVSKHIRDAYYEVAGDRVRAIRRWRYANRSENKELALLKYKSKYEDDYNLYIKGKFD